MNITLNQKIGARFKLIVRKVCDDSVVKETPFFCNLVLNTGLDRMSVGTFIDRCCVGSGNSTPNNAQVSLDSFVASTTANQSNTAGISTVSPCYYWGRRTWRFAQGVATGNLSEVGLGWTNTNLWNRSLIKDINGNPTTITVLSDEYLDVISEIRFYPTELATSSFNLYDKNNTLVSSHNVTIKPYMSNNGLFFFFNKISVGSVVVVVSTGDIGATITQMPSGTSSNSTKSREITYPTARSCLNTVTLGLNDANIIHKSLYFSVDGVMSGSGGIGYQMQINPPITVKNNTREMEYKILLNWDRYVP